ncbi:hormogonium polysaccharide secretion pseudopilin HpsC [Nodularia sphaerocarpa CS-585]|nr:hormogonium polysaccharide secretion pseudopilin HpsC [Nodularia sphaerocarpa]MDB9372703.1 hormogonium polysaccharide secretion pseudopilin HpsC [Nodularia sphaerocarpa CS-585]MDB9377857.1 hormogonium polysaccharide secretion pseudopilin HpsC [Nodularia sphaerocarpa CS-585A2]
MKMLKFLLRSQIKSSKVMQKPGGFTLIELLVAALIASIIITPLLGFMVSVMRTDRQEQAKANSEQEIQTALNYISRELKQAVYIYDADGVEAIRDQLPYADDNQKSPVLVFWKRDLVREVIAAATGDRDDAFVYSLVAYYLIKDSTASPTWSNASRIARWQIQDGVIARTGGVSCDGYDTEIKYITGNCPNEGFASFTQQLEEVGSLEQAMNQWQKNPDRPYNLNFNKLTVLTDYIDQTPILTGSPNCPADFTSPPVTPGNITGFYACVDVENVTAQVFIRGNALARLESNPNNINYSAANSSYFPKTSVRTQGRGFIFR